jgi:hypothetical protein
MSSSWLCSLLCSARRTVLRPGSPCVLLQAHRLGPGRTGAGGGGMTSPRAGTRGCASSQNWQGPGLGPGGRGRGPGGQNQGPNRDRGLTSRSTRHMMRHQRCSQHYCTEGVAALPHLSMVRPAVAGTDVLKKLHACTHCDGVSANAPVGSRYHTVATG